MYFRPTENESFIQFVSITNDDVMTNNIRHQLGAYVTFATGKKMESQASFFAGSR